MMAPAAYAPLPHASAPHQSDPGPPRAPWKPPLPKMSLPVVLSHLSTANIQFAQCEARHTWTAGWE